jgi:hypothetical protein
MQAGGGNNDIQVTEDVQRTLAPHALSHDPSPKLSGYKG